LSEEADQLYKKLIPRIEEGIKLALGGEINKLTSLLENKVFSLVWDRAIVEIGQRLNIPKQIVEGLQGLNDKVNNTVTYVEETISKLTVLVTKFKETIKEEDLNKTVTMTYKNLIKEKVKSAFYWFSSGITIGFLAGVVIALTYWIG
jgi:hypothetical protein